MSNQNSPSWNEENFNRKPGPDNPRLHFARAGKQVMLGQRCVCVATSTTMARRIMNALNQYEPNERGY